MPATSTHSFVIHACKNKVSLELGHQRTDLAQASLACGHLARAMQLAEAPAEKPHGLDVAQHPDELLLVQLERGQWHTKLLPLSKVPDQT